MNENRRYAKFFISQEYFKKMFKLKKYQEIVDIYIDKNNREITVTLTGKNFKELNYGEVIPVFQLTNKGKFF